MRKERVTDLPEALWPLRSVCLSNPHLSGLEAAIHTGTLPCCIILIKSLGQRSMLQIANGRLCLLMARLEESEGNFSPSFHSLLHFLCAHCENPDNLPRRNPAMVLMVGCAGI